MTAVKCQCGQQFYSELHLLDILMTGFMGSPSYNIKNVNILLFTHEFNRKHHQTLKAKHSGKEHGLKYCILGVNSLLLFDGVLWKKIA